VEPKAEGPKEKYAAMCGVRAKEDLAGLVQWVLFYSYRRKLARECFAASG
jgi:hypothetical protein